MEISKLVGQNVMHISYGPGEILTANDKLVMVRFETGEYKKFQFPQAFGTYLKLNDEALMSEIQKEIQIRKLDDERKEKEDREKAKLRVQQDAEKQMASASPAKPNKEQARRRTTSKTRSAIKEEPRVYDGIIIDLETSFATHAEALNTCFGYHYVHYQKAGKDLENGFMVWFPRIAKKVSGQYLTSDNYWGWLNILSDNGDTITQMDNPDFPYSGDGPDKRYRIIFARFEGENKYRFIGFFGRGERIQNGDRYTRLGTKFDTGKMKIVL